MRSLIKILGIGAALAATACKPDDRVAAPDRAARASAPGAGIPPARADLRTEEGSPDLFGAWIVRQVTNSQPAAQSESWDTILLIGLDQLEVLSQCITIGPFDYDRTVGGGISVRQSPVVPRASPANLPAPVKCARMLSPAEATLGPLLLAAREVRANADGTIAISGPAGTLVAHRPAGALRNPHGNMPPPRLPPLLGAWRFVAIDGRVLPPNERMELLLRPNRIEWRSGCIREARERAGGETRLIPGGAIPASVCERMETASESAVGRLIGNPMIARMSQDGKLQLQGSGVTAQLEPLIR